MLGLALTIAAITAQGPTSPGTTSPGPRSPELTVYNGGFALVKEKRTLNLVEGQQQVDVPDVAALIQPTSVMVRSLDSTKPIEVMEQNYQFDLISPTAILAKSVGRKVTFIRTVAGKRDVLTGTLLSAPVSIIAGGAVPGEQTYNGMVIRTDDGRIVLNPTGEIQVGTVPKGLISQPTLMWRLYTPVAGPRPINLSYITNGMSWHADYILNLVSPTKADLQGWVTLTNTSGATYENAKLKLLAGDVNRVVPQMALARSAFGGALGAPAPVREQPLFEYHLYTLGFPTTVQNNETKQVQLLSGHNITVKKRLIIDALREFGYYRANEGEIGVGDIKPQVRLEFVNSKSNGLGIALPAGKFRIYMNDSDGSAELLGEDQIDHTPKDETISLVVGRSFDVRATRKRLNFEEVSANVTRETFSVQVRNRKDTEEDVEVLERHYGDWTVLNTNTPFKKEDATTMEFNLSLAAGAVKTIQYQIETKW